MVFVIIVNDGRDHGSSLSDTYAHSTVHVVVTYVQQLWYFAVMGKFHSEKDLICYLNTRLSDFRYNDST